MKKNTLYAFTIGVNGANPNGDPDGENRPRTDMNGEGYITCHCLKHKIRREMALAGVKVLISEQTIDKNDNETSYLKRCFEKDGVVTETKKNGKKDDASTKEMQKNIRSYIMTTFRDIPMFGHAATLKICDKVRMFDESITGAFSVDNATSIGKIDDNIVVGVCSKCVSSVEKETKDTEHKDTFGARHIFVKEAVYVGFAGINYNIFEKNHCTAEDEEAFDKALVNMYENDASVARPIGTIGIVEVVKMIDDGKTNSSISDFEVKRALKKCISEDGKFNREAVEKIAKASGRIVEFKRESIEL